MWVRIICGLLIYTLFQWWIHGEDFDDDDEFEPNVNLVVAEKLEKIYGGKVYVGLRIPDADSGDRLNVEMVLVSRGKEVLVITVKNLDGFVEFGNDGAWICTSQNGHRQWLVDPVMEMKQQVSTLESYLETRGVILPSGCLKGRVVLPNPKCITTPSISWLPDVICFEKWNELKPQSKARFSSWVKDTFRGPKDELQNEIIQKLHFVLSTAPMWDRLELTNGNHMFGEFTEFRGKSEDLLALRIIKRSKVARLIVKNPTTVFSFLGGSEVVVQYTLRDYRNERSSTSEVKVITVQNRTEILFQPFHSRRMKKLKLSKVVSLILSA